MLILQLKRGQTVVSANVASDGVLDSLKDYWGDVSSVWDTVGRAAHLDALAALATDLQAEVSVANGQGRIQAAGKTLWSGPVAVVSHE